MAKVHLWASLRRFAEGQEVVEVEAATVGQMLDALERAHPGLGPAIKAGLSVAVDGEVIANNRAAPVQPTSEVFLLQRLKGG
ncbi:MoaD/ThiS family protein [Tabrizicola sp.]|uniref:MoaD/ThiS family protein n=1 Tax=Tabrizicola sp. TaxID=2005166 RepID=UPI0025E6A33C|nr:MoaD/ThiS family protein [Tabrizicola sp.]MBY0350050.1 MoaD/ThiS family protein [Tabrizicola sp.]MDK2775605.1 MoaD/ThiS family protein [Tabrizicola sp.]